MTIGSSLRTKMLAPHGPVVLYETVPPRAGTPVGRMRDIASRFAERISGVHIDAINIPEIRDEPRRSQDPRPFPYLAIKPRASTRGCWQR